MWQPGNQNQNQFITLEINVLKTCRLHPSKVGVISHSQRLRLITLTETLIILEIRKPNRIIIVLLHIGPIYTGDGWSIWNELGQMVAHLVIRLCIQKVNTVKQTDQPFWLVIHDGSSHKMDNHCSSCGWMILLLARIYTETDYQTSYHSLPKLVLDRWSVSNKKHANLT